MWKPYGSHMEVIWLEEPGDGMGSRQDKKKERVTWKSDVCIQKEIRMSFRRRWIVCPRRVIVPRDEWKSGAIHLKSNVKLYLEEGCVIHFSSCMEDYLPPVFTRWEGVECYNYSPLIYAADCENVTICGTGVLDGAGSAWWHRNGG